MPRPSIPISAIRSVGFPPLVAYGAGRTGALSRTPYFLIHVFYGGLLLIVLTALFWEWSGMASLGFFACVFLGPVILLFQAWWLRKRMRESRFHVVAVVLIAARIS